jgi:hypothetical protein
VVQKIDCCLGNFWDSSLKFKIDSIVKEKKLTETRKPDETHLTVSIITQGVKDIFYSNLGSLKLTRARWTGKLIGGRPGLQWG